MKTEGVVANILVHAPAQVREMSVREKSLARIVTTSWDDGDPFDLRVGEWLAVRSLPGTFYLPVKGHVEIQHRTSRMSLAEMLELSSQGFEIGAHGVSHPDLSLCDRKRLIVEVESSKKRLEDDLGKRVSMFAYPRGRHNKKVIAAVKQAGYTGARTTAMLGSHLTFDPFRMPTSVHVFPHTRIEYVRNLARAWELGRAWMCATHFRRANNWVELAKLLFDSVLRGGGIWHLYGHSWEIEELKLWDGLKEVLDYVANRPGVTYVSNGTAVQMRTSKLACVTCAPQPTTQ